MLGNLEFAEHLRLLSGELGIDGVDVRNLECLTFVSRYLNNNNTSGMDLPFPEVRFRTIGTTHCL